MPLTPDEIKLEGEELKTAASVLFNFAEALDMRNSRSNGLTLPEIKQIVTGGNLDIEI